MLSIRKTLVVAIAFGLLVAFSGAAAAHGGPAHAHEQQVKVIRMATDQYHDVSVAVADGYVPDDHCVPGMGYHYVNPLLVDDVIEVPHPEVLIYAPDGDGVKLAGVEYLSTQPFSLYGHEAEYVPFLGLYALHVWVWEDNPDGMFAPFNPNIACPAFEAPDHGEEDGLEH